MYGETIKRLREKKKIRVAALADLVGVSRQAIYHLEADLVENPGVKIIQGIANALGVDVREIFKGK